jgi:8-oxo-dGTP pyrophosphatase MutT (NUDIX family)
MEEQKKSKFNDRPNYHLTYKYDDGCGVKIDHDFWISRSVAVVGVVLADTVDGLKILITKRSEKMPDEAGKWCIPCGYLNYNETTHEAMVRELYEETSLDLRAYNKMLMFNNDKQPIHINDNPKSKRQNVSLIFLSSYDFRGKNMKNFPIYTEYFTNNETEKVCWVKLYDFYDKCSQCQWAFHHDDVIKDSIIFFNKHFERK